MQLGDQKINQFDFQRIPIGKQKKIIVILKVILKGSGQNFLSLAKVLSKRQAFVYVFIYTRHRQLNRSRQAFPVP